MISALVFITFTNVLKLLVAIIFVDILRAREMGGDIYERNFVLQITEQVPHAKQTSHTVLDRQRDRETQAERQTERQTDKETKLNLLLCLR